MVDFQIGTTIDCLLQGRESKVIKVIEGYELKKGADIQPLFQKLRSYAMTFPGFISAEYIKSVQGTPIAALLYNWQALEDWEGWKNSKLRQQILQEEAALFESNPRITIYELVPTSRWIYTKLRS